MNGEDNNLTLGEVETPQEEQPQVPGIAMDEYLKRLRKLGVDGADAVSIMSGNGYDGQQVYNHLVSEYETQREEYLRQKKEAERRAKEAEERSEVMSAEKKKSDRFDSSEGRFIGDFDDSDSVKARGDIDQSKYQQIFEENPELNDPYSAVALPQDLIEAMEAGEDVELRYQSFKNDEDVYDNHTAKQGVAAINQAIKDKDQRLYDVLRGELKDMGYNYPESVEDGASYSTVMFDFLEKEGGELITQRNLINDQYGLPSGFNPDSDVDFMYAMRESLNRQRADLDSSELASYDERIREEADDLMGGFAGESLIRGFAQGFIGEIIDSAQYGLPAMYYEHVGDDQKYNAYMQANRRSQDIREQGKRNRFKERFDIGSDLPRQKGESDEQYQARKDSLVERVASMGMTEATEAMVNGEISASDYHTKMLYETGNTFGNALSYMIPIGKASKAVRGAEMTLKSAKRAAAVKGGLTAAQSAVKTAERSLRLAKITNGGVYATLGITSGASHYSELYDRKDLTFAEKMTQATLVGVAEATLGKMFSNVDRLLVSGAARTVKAKTTQEFARVAKEKLAEMTKKKALRAGFRQTGKGLSEEFLEEFGVEVVAQGAEIINDLAMGRTPREIDWYALIDAGMAGIIGAGPTSALAGVGSYRAHNSLLKRRKQVSDQIGEIDEAIGAAESADERKRLNSIKDGLSAELMVIDGESRDAFNNLSEGQRRRLLKIHRDMAYTENALRKKDLSKEERKQLEGRYELLLRSKQEIENSGEKPNTARDEEAVPAQNASGADSAIDVNETTKEDDIKASTSEPATEAAPKEQEQEAVQLSSFDETQDQKEAPAAEEAAPAETEATTEQTAEQPAKEGVSSFDNLGGDLIDVADPNVVGEGKLSLEAALAVNRMSKGFGKLLNQSGYKVNIYSRQAFEALIPEKDKEGADVSQFGGFVDHDTKTINLPVDARAEEVIEEFGHAALKDIIGKDAKARKDIYNTLKGIAKKNSDVASILTETRENPVYKNQGEAAIEEESIIAVLVAYAQNPDALGKGGFVNKMRVAINKIFARIAGKDAVVIKNEEAFNEFARKFARAARGEQVDVADPNIQKQDDLKKRPNESEAEYRERLARLGEEMDPMTEEQQEQQRFEDQVDSTETARFAYGKRKTEFTYLKDTEVFYKEDPYVEIGEPGPTFERQRSMKIKVNDYFHFRNWYNHMTSNGARPARVTEMYFIKDGKKYTVKPPKPKTDKDGNVVRVQGAENARISNIRRAQDRQSQKARALKDERKRVFDLGRDAEILKTAGIDPAEGMTLVPGFNREEYAQIEDANEKYSYLNKFRREVLFNRSAEEQAEVLEIANENLQLLRESGLSVSEIEAADKSVLLNMSGRTPSFLAQDGDVLNSGNIRFAVRKKKAPRRITEEEQKAYMDEVRKQFPGIKDEDLFVNDQDLEDWDGARSVLLGYDRSRDKVGTGIFQQLRKLINGKNIISTHRNRPMLNRVWTKIVNEIAADARSKNPKGYIVVATAALDIGSLAGNPNIFADIARKYVDGGATLQEKTRRANEILEFLSKSDYDAFIKASNRGEGEIYDRIRRQIRPSKKRFKIDSKETLDDFLKIFSNAEGFDDSGFAKSFDDRNRIGRKFIKEFLTKGDRRGRTETQAVNDYLVENYADLALEKVPGASVITLQKVPYEITEGGVPKVVVDEAKDESAAFPSAIVSKTAENTKILKSPIPIESAFPTTLTADVIKDQMSKKERKAFEESSKEDQDLIIKERRRQIKEKDPTGIKYAKQRGARGTEGKIDLGPRLTTRDGKVYSYGRRGGQSFTMKEETSFQKWKNLWVRRLQDKYVDIFNIQETIERQKGPLDKSKDFRMAEELMYGKAAEDLAKLDKSLEDITAAMKKAGVKVDEVSRYIYALHAKERNAVILERSKGSIKEGSGMSDAEADAVINAANKKSLDPIVSMIRKIQNDTRKTMVKFGLETQETIDAFNSQFKNYVPLAGLSVDEQLSSPYPTGGAGLNVFGSTTKRAVGRKSEAENILAQIVAQNASVHIKARTNEALNTLYNLIKENPNTKVWRLVDEKAGIDPNDPRIVAVRVDGKQKYIMFNDASYAQNLRGMNLPQTNAFVRALRVPAQWLRRSFTTLNPEFVISNFSRDIQAAVFNAAAEADIEGGTLNSKKTIARMMGLVPGTLKTLVKNSVKKGGDPAIEKYFGEFKEDGGKTGWAYAKSLDQIASDLEGATNEKTRTQEILGKAKNFADTIEGVNDAFENSIRLAAYIAARESGVTREKAAQMAKNITVNFNKQGEYGPALNAVYLFFNASIQGTARLGRSLLNLKPQKRPDGTDRTKIERVNSAQWMAAGLMTFNAMLTMLGYAMSDEDEDGTLFWDKIPDYVKERNLIIMRPNGKDYFKIPMPYGFNVFANMGNALVEGSQGGRTETESMMFMFNSIMASFSPISFGQSKDLFVSAGKGAVPTVLKPFVDIMVNETYFGGPVTGENLPFGVQRPSSELAFRSPQEVKDFFMWMNEATGGSEYKSGALDFNPDKPWYMLQYFVGGAGQFVGRSLKLPRDLSAKLFSGEDVDIEAGDIPLARILYGEPSKYYDFELFNENKQEFKALKKEMEKAPVMGDKGRYKGISEGMNKTLNEVDKMLKQLRSAEREARKIDDYSERMARVQAIKDKQRKLIMRWNKIYENVRN